RSTFASSAASRPLWVETSAGDTPPITSKFELEVSAADSVMSLLLRDRAGGGALARGDLQAKVQYHAQLPLDLFRGGMLAQPHVIATRGRAQPHTIGVLVEDHTHVDVSPARQ